MNEEAWSAHFDGSRATRMRRALRLAVSLRLVAACLAAGCGFAQKPYTNDPLLRGGRGIWHSRDAVPPPVPLQQPVPPPPPVTSPRWD